MLACFLRGVDRAAILFFCCMTIFHEVLFDGSEGVWYDITDAAICVVVVSMLSRLSHSYLVEYCIAMCTALIVINGICAIYGDIDTIVDFANTSAMVIYLSLLVATSRGVLTFGDRWQTIRGRDTSPIF